MKLLLYLLILIYTLPATAQQPDSFQIIRHSESVTILQGGSQYNNIVILSTGQGIVIFDTHDSPENGKRIRQLANSLFPGKIFLYVINTHHHYDHIQGNQVFSDATIIGHFLCEQKMREAAGSENPQKDRIIAEGEGPTGKLPPPPRNTYSVDKEGYTITPPDISFREQLYLNCGSHTIELLTLAGMHTETDIIAYVPEENMLITGDLFFQGYIPHFNRMITPSIDGWKENLKRLAGFVGNENPTVITGHGEFMNYHDFLIQAGYITALYDTVRRKSEEGLTAEEIADSFPLTHFIPNDYTLRDVRPGSSTHLENIQKLVQLWNGK